MELQTMRFEKAFFVMDTLQIDKSLNKLNDSFPGFTKDFLFNITLLFVAELLILVALMFLLLLVLVLVVVLVGFLECWL